MAAARSSVVAGSTLLVTRDLVRAGRLAHALSSAGFVVTLVFDDELACASLRDVAVQVVVVDLGALGPQPQRTLRTLHRQSAAPLLALVDRRCEDLEAVFTAGAAAALPVDIGNEELVAQVGALAGLGGAPASGHVVGLASWGPILIDHAHRRVLVHDQEVGVTPLQSRVLAILISAGGNVVTHSTLYRLLWRSGIDDDGQRLAAHVHRLRERLGGRSCAGALIGNVRGIGYRMLRPAEVTGLEPRCDRTADSTGRGVPGTASRPERVLVVSEPRPVPAASWR